MNPKDVVGKRIRGIGLIELDDEDHAMVVKNLTELVYQLNDYASLPKQRSPIENAIKIADKLRKDLERLFLGVASRESVQM